MNFYNRFLRLPLYPSLSAGETDIVVRSVRKVFGS